MTSRLLNVSTCTTHNIGFQLYPTLHFIKARHSSVIGLFSYQGCSVISFSQSITSYSRKIQFKPQSTNQESYMFLWKLADYKPPLRVTCSKGRKLSLFTLIYTCVNLCRHTFKTSAPDLRSHIYLTSRLLRV
jgi:hypothetical protein